MPRRLKGQKIAIIEDDVAIGESLNAFFGDDNSVLTFVSAEDALAAEAQLSEVGVFILDYRLPGMDGVQLFQKLRQTFTSAKYIMITGEMSYDLAEDTRKLGLDALILKPFDFSILEENIATLISAAA